MSGKLVWTGEAVEAENARAELAAMRRKYPLAHLDGIVLFDALVREASRRVRVVCQGVDRGCGWAGYRKGGQILAAKKPCPRCGSSVAVRESEDT